MANSKRGPVSRRGFLIASFSALLAACRSAARTVIATATPAGQDQTPAPLSPSAAPEGLPEIAGVVTSLTDQTVTLRAASGERTIQAGSAAVFALDGSEIPLGSLPLGGNIAAWGSAGEEGALQAFMLRELPIIPSLPPNLNPLIQPEPTGETTRIGPLTMLTRAGWGAAGPQLDAENEHGLFDPLDNPEGWLRYADPLDQVLRTVIVHHSALEFPSGPRPIQEYHVRQRGYADIAYHYLIDTFGQLYEGRAISVRGAHTAGANTGSVGVALLGNMSLHPPLRAQLTTLQALIAALISLYGITHLAGHRDFQPGETECPGDQLESFLPQLAAQWGLVFGTGGYVPPPWVMPRG